MTVVERLAAAVAGALSRLGIDADPSEVHLERPQRPEHGDFSTNAALVLAKAHGRQPRELAAELAARLDAARLDDACLDQVEQVEVAGPGFVNFRLSPAWLHDVLRQVVEEGADRYGAPQLGNGERVQVEFVSANPTGPLHVGNGWFGSYGDALA
ncbi:MAG: arginine--tRNA ligase, partial [Actinomycetota bacterium]|nr:arginine--tRNA ligase [Actinomycetota bacterium]